MHITDLQVKNFKRFTDFEIRNIPDSSRLVLLIGANGSGKSSLFDVFNYYIAHARGDAAWDAWDYYKKAKDESLFVSIQFDEAPAFESSDGTINGADAVSDRFYGRTSFRQIPRLTRTALGQYTVNIDNDTDRPRFFIDRDERFENDIEKVIGMILEEVFRTDETASSELIRERVIDPINKALANIFGAGNGTKLALAAIIPPLEGEVAQINFVKGASKIHYNYLSAGEKEIFNILINLLSRSYLYQDSVYFFDEIDLHLNTALQYRLLDELLQNWIPANSQIWLASHSLGFIEYAKQNKNASIIDFDTYDFDRAIVLTPESKDNPNIYNIAVDKEFLSSLFTGRRIYFVGNKDDRYYNSANIADAVFVSEDNRDAVYNKALIDRDSYGLIDRDFLTDDDIDRIKKTYVNLLVLEYYCIENYLYHPDNLLEYYRSQGNDYDREVYIRNVTDAKNDILDRILPGLVMARAGYPFFREPQHNRTVDQDRFRNNDENKEQSKTISEELRKDDFASYYKYFSMKSYGKEIPERQNLLKSELAKTSWFKAQVETLLSGDL
jgi:ABC-type transport system involved in cytochrome c biogenesis ATPase subunit